MTASLISTLPAELTQAIHTRFNQVPAVGQLQMTLTDMAPGECCAQAPRIPAWDGYYQSVHGGILATLADTLACFAVMTHTGPQQAMTTTDLHIRYLRPALGTVYIHAEVIKRGKSLCPVQVTLWDAPASEPNAKQIAVAQVTYMLLDDIPHARA